MHPIRRTLLLAAVATFAATGTAFAHVEAFVTTTSEGDEALVQFSIPHGCDDKGTTKLEINFPSEVLSVRPVVSAGWTGTGGTAAESMEHDHADEDGTTAADHSDMDMGASSSMEDDGSHTVTWTADSPLSHDQLGTVTAYMVVPQGVDELWMPAIQTCEGGTTNEWTAKDEGAEMPAPHIDFAATSSASSDDSGASDDDAATAKADDSDDSSTNMIAIVALVLGALGTLLGFTARRGSKD